jgi:hypothetical protein
MNTGNVKTKACNECGVELEVGVNWYASMEKNSTFICKTHWKKRTIKHHRNNPEARKISDKKYRDRIGNQRSKEWMASNPDKVLMYREKLDNSIPSGVYGIYYRWLLLYVGESGKPYKRVVQHLSTPETKGGTKNGTIRSSKVAKLLVERGLNGKYLSFNMLDYADDKDGRLEIETRYRRELKPYINPL